MTNNRIFLVSFGAFCLLGVLLISAGSTYSDESAASREGSEFVIRIADTLHQESIDGRVLVLISDKETPEPRYQARLGTSAIPVFGVTVDELKPGESVTVDATAFGYPFESLSDLPAGSYYVQVLIHKYETFHLSTRHTVKLPMNRGAGQNWRRAPGNLYSEPMQIDFAGNASQVFEITVNQINPPILELEDTEYIRHVRMRSDLLSEFWGRDIRLGAHVLVPEGFDDHPEARYPLMIFHGHYPNDFGGFRTEPPDPELEPDYSTRFSLEGYNRIQQQEAYDFYRKWISPNFPRFLVIEIQHDNPYYDDSYAVNSASIGPYGDALTYELIPYIEQQFRGIGEGWARFTYGGSTGGWEALAVQIFYPDEYNGAFSACPDPIDFREYMLVNIYEDENAYYEGGPFRKIERPGHRDWLGNVSATVKDYNYFELAIGTNSRSGDQYDIWQAVYSPQGEDGYPKPIWDKYTGDIDREVAEYWRENYDLRYILERDWASIGPKLVGKIHVYAGDMDNYYLNNATYLMEEFLESTTNPYYGGDVDYGDRAEHCWNGDQENPNAISRLRYNTMYLPMIMEQIKKTAPEGADLTSWRY